MGGAVQMRSQRLSRLQCSTNKSCVGPSDCVERIGIGLRFAAHRRPQRLTEALFVTVLPDHEPHGSDVDVAQLRDERWIAPAAGRDYLATWATLVVPLKKI